jgi:hypothetical protein
MICVLIMPYWSTFLCLYEGQFSLYTSMTGPTISFIHSDSRADELISHSAVLFHLYQQILLIKHVEMK